MNAYFISGLGADKRIFSKLKLNENINVIHLEWIPPTINESLPAYAERLSSAIDISKPFALIGVSFGAMIAVEISKILKPAVTIVISGIIKSSQLPALYRFAGRLGLWKFIPPQLLKSSNKLTGHYYFGTRTSTDKTLLSRIIKDTDPHFLKWAIGSILTWKNEIRPERIFHIHGINDKILYLKNAVPDFVIENGTHFMVYQNADEISRIIDKLLLNLPPELHRTF